MSPVIPRVPAGECHVWIADAVRVPSPALLELLDARERARHDSLVRAQDRALYLTAHALLRQVVAAQLGGVPREVRFTHVCRHCERTEPHGKPGLEGSSLEISLSHSGGRVAVALSPAGPVGVDIEQVARDMRDLTEVVLAPEEREELERLAEAGRPGAFTRYWARKEAVLKATGDGLVVSPALLTVSPPWAPAALLAWRERAEPHRPVRLHDVDAGDGYRAAVAVLGAPCRVVRHEVGYDGDGILGRPRRG
ncbi:4'-phosphopantetheinyl transferase family protein [Streptomyces sp. NPDC047821]|uniref:4'-phosphopantetheinyl transferase family protein n=1 Tax=unclassified Streptomyces TaxID=2593676 RepID=UPI003628A28F